MKTDELKIRNTSKKNAIRASKNAEQYDFLVKTGIKQDDIAYMSIFDTPMPGLINGQNMSLGEYLEMLGNMDLALKALKREVK